MKKLYTLILFLFPTIIFAQQEYRNLNFEKTDSVGKTVFQWQGYNKRTDFFIDTSSSSSGKSSLLIYTRNREDEGATYYLTLPKSYYEGLRTIKISVDVLMGGQWPYAGLWCKVMKNKNYLGGASTINGSIPFPINPTYRFQATNAPVTPGAWTHYSFEVQVKEDPTEVLMGLYVSSGQASFDNIRISVNNTPLDNLVYRRERNN